jgi:hypothetical protein
MQFLPSMAGGHWEKLEADIFINRIEFDKKDPKVPEQAVLKSGICSALWEACRAAVSRY